MQRLHRIAILAAFALVGGAAIPAPAPAALLPFTSAATQCKPGETIIYSCRFGKSVGSACLSKNTLHYRFVPAGKPAIDIASAPDWSNIHIGGVIGGGGHEDHLRFTANGHDYVIFEGQAGQYTDVPGMRFSGIVVMQGTRDVVRLECPGKPILRQSWTSELHDRAGAVTGKDGMLEDSDPRFDMWL